MGETDAISRPLVKYFFNSVISLNTVDCLESYCRIRFDLIDEIITTLSSSKLNVSSETILQRSFMERPLWLSPFLRTQFSFLTRTAKLVLVEAQKFNNAHSYQTLSKKII